VGASGSAAGASASPAAAGSGVSAAGSGAMFGPASMFIAGDSTVMTYTSGELEGWGQEIGQFFDDRISIVNKAIGGRSVAYFMYEVETNAAGDYQCADSEGSPKFRLDASGKRIDTARWSEIKNGMHAGDFLLVQFGHNDETHTCPRYVSTDDYARELGNMAKFARSKGATPIFVTPMGHRAFDGATVRKTLVAYANAMREAGEQQGVEVVDLNARSFEYYMMVGDSSLANNIFDGGTTHFVKAGAIKMAELIVGELEAHASPLAVYLK
jgi:lysophospholipase L1-like esterase